MNYLLVIPIWLLTWFTPTSTTDLTVNKLDEILDNHTNAMGGMEAWKKVETLIVNLNIGGGGVMEAYTKKPDKFRLTMRIGGHQSTKAYNGSKGWAVHNGQERKMPAGEAREMSEEPNFFDELMLARELDYDIKLLTKEKLKDHYVYKIQVTKSMDDIVTYFVNVDNYLIERIDEQSFDPRFAGTPFSTLLTNYKETNGLMFPRYWTIIQGQEKPRKLEVSSIAINEPLNDSWFEYRRK